MDVNIETISVKKGIRREVGISDQTPSREAQLINNNEKKRIMICHYILA